MESFQTVGILVGIIGVILGLLIVGFAPGGIGLVGIGTAIVSFISIFLVLTKRHAKGVGITIIVLGVLFNWLLLIPGIMAVRYKPQFVNAQITK